MSKGIDEEILVAAIVELEEFLANSEPLGTGDGCLGVARA